MRPTGGHECITCCKVSKSEDVISRAKVIDYIITSGNQCHACRAKVIDHLRATKCDGA